MGGQFGRIKNDFSRAEAYAKRATIREIEYVETLRWKKALVIFFIGFFLGFAVSNFAHASGMTANANYNPANVTITGGTINSVPVTSIQNPNAVAITGGTISASTINAATSQSLNGKLIMSATAPTIAFGFGTSPSIAFNNGTAAFYVDVGSGGTASTGAINMNVAALHYWSCAVTIDNDDLGTGKKTIMSSIGNQIISFTNVTISTGAAAAWTGNDVFFVNCIPM